MSTRGVFKQKSRQVNDGAYPSSFVTLLTLMLKTERAVIFLVESVAILLFFGNMTTGMDAS